MVNNGPSKGCRECRARKLKCDGERPECHRCNKSKIKCSGYDIFHERRELVWTENARFCQGKGLKRRISKANLAPERIDAPSSQSSPPYGLAQDLEQQAICFFFHTVYPRLPGYYTDELPHAYSREKHASILSTATAALAFSFTSLDPQQVHFNSYAVSKYAECLRLVRRAANDAETISSDAFLMAVCVLGSWEHSRWLALEPCATRCHRDGAIAVVRSRSKGSFSSQLSQQLLTFLRAQVIYDCVATANPELLDDFVDLINERRSQQFVHLNQGVYSDFYTLSDEVRPLAGLRAREKELFKCTQDESDFAIKALNLVIDAKREYKQLSEWPADHPWRHPCRSCPLSKCKDYGSDAVYPSRIDIYWDTTQATMCNSWHIAQILVLTIIANVATLLLSSVSQDSTSLSLSAELEYAEHLIREHIDDFCSTIPYILYPDRIEAAARHYPHGPNSASMPNDLGPEAIAGMSRLKKTLEVGSQARGVPRS